MLGLPFDYWAINTAYKNKGPKCTVEPIFPSVYGHVLKMIRHHNKKWKESSWIKG